MSLDFAVARENMIENDVRTNDVTDRRLIAAMRAVPKERFVPEAIRDLAYSGLAVPVGGERFLLDARSFSKMVQAAEIGHSDRVLDVGCATGYSTTILAKIAGEVVAVEQDEGLAKTAETNLSQQGATNAVVVRASLAAGAPARGPYDAILVNGMIEELPDTLTAQLKQGGRLLAVLATANRLGRAMHFIKANNVVSGRAIFDATVPRLPGFEKKKSFVF